MDISWHVHFIHAIARDFLLAGEDTGAVTDRTDNATDKSTSLIWYMFLFLMFLTKSTRRCTKHPSATVSKTHEVQSANWEYSISLGLSHLTLAQSSVLYLSLENAQEKVLSSIAIAQRPLNWYTASTWPTHLRNAKGRPGSLWLKMLLSLRVRPRSLSPGTDLIHANIRCPQVQRTLHLLYFAI